MAINWEELEKKAKQQAQRDLSRNGGKNYKGSASAGLTVNTAAPKKKEIPVNTAKRTKPKNKRKLDAGAKAIQTEAIKTNAFPQAAVRFNERILNDGILAPVSIPYQIATGKKLLNFGFEPANESARKGAAVGNFVGTAAAYGTGYGAANKAITKGAGKLLATDAGKKATAKIIGSKLGQRAGKETAGKVAEGLARNLVGDATVGTLMNLSAARGEGLQGKELAKDMAVNAAFDAVLGTGFEFAPMALKAGKNALKNTKLEPRLVDGKVKNVRVRQQIPQNTTYKVSRSGNINERLGAKLINEELGEIPRNVQNTPQEIPYAKRALAPEAQKKVFDAVEKRSGAKIAFADLPEGVDGTYQNGVITISNSAANPAYTVLKHELTHHIETSGHYAELSDFIQNSMRDAGYNVDQSINDIISDYAKMGKNLTAEEAQKEFTAKFAEEYLFNSEKSIERLARENPNIFRQIYDWIVDTVRKIGASEETKFLIDAQRKYEKALRTVGKTEDAGTKYMFYKASSEDVLKAEKMKAAGASEAEIKAKLNLHQDARGEWVNELSDKGAKIYSDFDAHLYNSNKNYRRYVDMWKTGDIFNSDFEKLDELYGNVARSKGNLDQILEHDELFAKYPQARTTRVSFQDLPEGTRGGFNPSRKEIYLSNSLHGDDEIAEALLHETQHNIQRIDGRNSGANADYIDREYAMRKFGMTPEELYLRNAGEAEARQTAHSRRMTDDERRSRVPEKGIDFVDSSSYFQDYVGTRSDGIEVYETSPEVKNLPTKEKIKRYKQYMEEEYRGRTAKFTKNGETYYARFDDADIRKNIYGDKKSDAKGKTAKLNAGAEGDIFDLIEGARYQSSSAERGKNGVAHKGVENWDYYVKTVQIDGQVFDEVVNVRLNNKGEYVYSIQLNQNKKTPALPPAPAYNDKSQMATLKIGETTDATNSIPTNGKNVNEKTSFSAGNGLRKEDLLNRLKTASESLYGEKGNKYLQIPYASEIPVKKTEPQPIPYAQKETPQPIPHADTIPKKRNVTSESPDITTDERWDYMLETAPGERHARKLTEEEWTGPKKHADDKFKAEHGITDRQAEVFYNEPRTEIKESKKAQRYERRQVREADKAIREALDINKYSDGPYIKKRMDETVEKMKNGSLSKAEKEQLFDDMFANGIKIDGEFATQYQDLKKVLRETPIKVSESIKKNIADFGDFRRRNVNKIRLNDQEGVQADIFYDELRNTYPELFPEVNTPEEMVEKIAEVADSIKIAEKRVSEDIYADEIYTEAKKRFEEVMDNLENEVNIVKKNSEKHRSDITIDQMHEFITDLGKFKREAEKVKSKVILSDGDRKLKDMLLQGQMTPETLRKFNLNANNIIEVYNAEKPVFEMKNALTKLGDKTKEGYREAARRILEGSENWKDKRMGFRYDRETPERNFVDIAGKEAGERINREFITPIHEHEAAATRMKNELRGEVKKLKISNQKAYDLSGIEIEAPGLDKKQKATEATLVQLYGEKLIRKEDLEFLGADVAKIENAVQTLRGIYNQLIEKANNELIRHGYEPIEFRKDYFPHFSEERSDGMIAKIGSFLRIDVKKDELPTDIIGLTHMFKPGRKWFGNALQRTGKTTEYNAVKGFDIYIEGVADIIHHTEDIQKLRALESELRFKYSDNGIKARIKDTKAKGLSREDEEKEILDILREGNTKLGGLAVWLQDYTNQLAGKKPLSDRIAEAKIGRVYYNATKAIENRVAANMVALNPGSWLTNFIPLVQAGELSPKYVIEGMAQTMGNRFRKVDDITDISSFLTNRKGSNVLWKSNLEKAQDFLTSPMQMIDNFTSEALVRAKYAEQLKKGVHPEEAIKTADRFAADIIADRSKGALPITFNQKNPIKKILTMYQVEVNNQWSHLLKDIPRSKENVAQVALAFTNFAVGAYIFNDVYERLVGRRSALDPISWVNDFAGDATGKKLPNFTEALEKAMKGQGISFEEVDTKSGGGTIASLGDNVAQDIPFVGGLFGGGRVPISSALPNVATIATNTGNLITGDVDSKKGLSAIGKELAKSATYIIPPVGGGQIKKTVESTRALAKGGVYGLDKEGKEQLKFAVDADVVSIPKGLLFGQYAIGNSGDYVDSGFKMLSAKKTRAYKALTETGMKNTEAEDFIRSLPSKTKDMRKAILNSNLTAKQKNAIGKVLDKNSPDYTSKDSFAYSQMSDGEKETIDKLTRSGMTQKKATRIYEAQNQYSSQAEKVNALLEEGYRDAVFKALGMGEKGIAGGKALHAAGLDSSAYRYTKEKADTNDSGNVSIKEIKKYLDTTSYSRRQKFALAKALTGCSDKNNPYR